MRPGCKILEGPASRISPPGIGRALPERPCDPCCPKLGRSSPAARGAPDPAARGRQGAPGGAAETFCGAHGADAAPDRRSCSCPLQGC